MGIKLSGNYGAASAKPKASGSTKQLSRIKSTPALTDENNTRKMLHSGTAQNTSARSSLSKPDVNRSSGETDSSLVPRYNARVKQIYNPGGKIIRSALGGKLDDNGIVRYAQNSDVDNNHYGKVQAMIDMAYGASPTARQNMPDRYYDVYDALQQGKGWNGYGLYADSPYMKSVWGNDALDVDAYNRLYAQGKVAGDGYLQQDGYVKGNGSPGGIVSRGSAPVSRPRQWDNEPFEEKSGVLGAYMKALEEQKNAYDAATQAAVSGLDGMRSGVNQQAQNAAQQAYIAYMQGERDLPQTLAAGGLSGGESESAALALQTNYENNRNSIVQNRDNMLNDISIQIAQAQAQGDMNKAQALSQYYNNLAGMSMQQWQTMYNAQLQREMAALQQQYSLEQQQRGFENEKAMLTYKQQLAQQEAAGKAAMSARGASAQSTAAGDETPKFGSEPSNPIGDGDLPIYTRYNPETNKYRIAGLGEVTPEELDGLVRSGKVQELRGPHGMKYALV